jgi:hypothetical protein
MALEGIYGIRGDIFPVQVIESGGLEGEGGGIWLKELRGGLNGERLREILEMSEKMPRGAPLSAYLYTVLQANGTGFKEMMGMSEVSFEAVLKEYGLTAKWEAEGLQKGLQTGLQKGLQQGMGEAVKRLQKHGMGPKEIAGVLELPLGTVRRYLKAE